MQIHALFMPDGFALVAGVHLLHIIGLDDASLRMRAQTLLQLVALLTAVVTLIAGLQVLPQDHEERIQVLVGLLQVS